MSCIWNVKCVTEKELTEEQMQVVICSKIANVLIREEKENHTLVNQK